PSPNGKLLSSFTFSGCRWHRPLHVHNVQCISCETGCTKRAFGFETYLESPGGNDHASIVSGYFGDWLLLPLGGAPYCRTAGRPCATLGGGIASYDGLAGA